MSTDIQRILNAKDKLVGEAEDVLARLFRTILADINMTEYHWRGRMRRYLEDPTNHILSTSTARSSARGNLNKELASRKMSWNVFLKGLKFLGPEWIKFRVEAGWNPNRSTIHELEMLMNQYDGAGRSAPAAVAMGWNPRRTTIHSTEKSKGGEG